MQECVGNNLYRRWEWPIGPVYLLSTKQKKLNASANKKILLNGAQNEKIQGRLCTVNRMASETGILIIRYRYKVHTVV